MKTNEKITCGICGDEIPSKVISVSRGSHYSQYEENIRVIECTGGGVVLDINGTDKLKTEIDILQKEFESNIIQTQFKKVFKSLPFEINEKLLQNENSISGLIGNLELVRREMRRNKILVRGPETLGRHNSWESAKRTSIPDVDLCKDCKTKFQHNRGLITIGFLSRNIPNLKIEENNKEIWKRIKNNIVEVSFKDR